MANEAEEILKRLALNKGVTGVIVVNPEGIPVRSTLENKVSVNYAGLVSELCDKARAVIKDLDPKNEFTFLRIRSMKNEIMVAPDKDYILIVIQEPVD